jgi:hypothetical protein
MINTIQKYVKSIRESALIESIITFFTLIKNFFFPTMVVACEINKGSDMLHAYPKLKLAGVSKYKIEMDFSERKNNGLAPPVMKIKVPTKHQEAVQALFL